MFYRTAKGLHARGHEVHLFCGTFFIDPPRGVVAHRVPCILWPRTARAFSFAFLAPKTIARYRCDAILSFYQILHQDLFRSGGGAHKTFVERMMKNSSLLESSRYRLSPYHRFFTKLDRYVTGKGSQRIVAPCAQVKQDLIQAYGVREEKIVILPNGVDHERFHPKRRIKEGRLVRERLSIPPDGKVVIFVGTGFRRKGLGRLLSLWESGAVTEPYLLVVGDDAQLMKYRRRWQSDKVRFLGAQAKVEEYYAASELLVLPSLYEAFGNVVLEALASGLPVVTVPGVGPADELRGELAEGILVNPDDSEELRKRIEYLLRSDRWVTLSREARTVAKRYTWDNYFDKLEYQLQSVRHRLTVEPAGITNNNFNGQP